MNIRFYDPLDQCDHYQPDFRIVFRLFLSFWCKCSHCSRYRIFNKGIIDFSIGTSNNRYFGMLISLWASSISQMTFGVAIFNSTTVKSLKVAYFSYNAQVITFLTSALTEEFMASDSDMRFGTGLRQTVAGVGFSTGAIDLTHDVFIMPFLVGFILDRGSSISSFFSIAVSL
jgi:hypothetical protein